MANQKQVAKVFLLILLVGSLFLSGCNGTPLDRAWLEADLAWTESSLAQLQERVDASADRRFLSAIEEIGSEKLLSAYDEYAQAYTDYMYSTLPESLWEQEWEKVLGKLIQFTEAYASELRNYISERYE